MQIYANAALCVCRVHRSPIISNARRFDWLSHPLSSELGAILCLPGAVQTRRVQSWMKIYIYQFHFSHFDTIPEKHGTHKLKQHGRVLSSCSYLSGPMLMHSKSIRRNLFWFLFPSKRSLSENCCVILKPKTQNRNKSKKKLAKNTFTRG